MPSKKHFMQVQFSGGEGEPTESTVKKLLFETFLSPHAANLFYMSSSEWSDFRMRLAFCCTGMAKWPVGVPRSTCDRSVPIALSENRCFKSILKIGVWL